VIRSDVRRQSLWDRNGVFLERVSAPLCGYAALRRFSSFLRCNVKRMNYDLKNAISVSADDPAGAVIKHSDVVVDVAIAATS
jgi:hypothetical protein